MPYFDDDETKEEPKAKDEAVIAVDLKDDIAAQLRELDEKREAILSAGKNRIKSLLAELAQLCKYHGTLKKEDFPPGVFATRKKRDAVVAQPRKKSGRKPGAAKQS